MRSPNWNECEVMLALDLYVNRNISWLNKMSDATFEIVALSKLLNSLDFYDEKPENFRSTGSIRMKLANFMELDNTYQKKSLGNVGNLDRRIWNEYADKHDELHRCCKKIISEHLKNSSSEIDEYIEKLNLYNGAGFGTYGGDFVKFARSLMRTASYYAELAKKNNDLDYSSQVLETSNNIIELLKWTENYDELVFGLDEYKEHAGVNLRPINKNNKKEHLGEQNELPIGKYVRSSFWKLVELDKLSNQDVEKLLSHKFSKEQFGIKPTFLIKINDENKIKEQITDENGYVRYWTSPIDIHGSKYCVCKEWFDNQRERYTKWLETVDIHPFYMIGQEELRKILKFIKEKDSEKVSITRKEITEEFPIEAIEEVIRVLLERGILVSFQGSRKEFVIDDYDALFMMMENASEYAGGSR